MTSRSSPLSTDRIEGIDPDGPATTLVLLRHGRTIHNAEARLQGQTDVPLDDHGLRQSARAGEHVRRRFDPDVLVTSRLARTRQTAEAAGLAELPTEVDDRWSEIDFGSYDERKIADVYVELGRAWSADLDFVPTGGESLRALHQRVSLACEDLISRHEGKTVVVVSHATAIKSAVAWALHGDAATILTMKINLASISTIVESRFGLLLAGFNELAHLE